MVGIHSGSTLETMASALNEGFNLAQEDLDLLLDQDVYRVAYSDNFIPNSYMDEGELTGIGIDVMDDIAEVTGIKVEYYDISAGEISIEDADISLIIDNFTTNPTSDAFISFQSVLAVLSTHEGEITTVAVQDRYGITAIDPALEGVEIVYYPSFTSGKEALDTGEVDSLLMATIGYEKIMDELDAGLYQLELLDTPVEFRFMFASDFPAEKVDVFNKLIAQIDDSTMSYLTQKHSNYIVRNYGLWDEILEHFNLVVVGFFAAFMFFGIVIFIGQLRRGQVVEYQMAHDSMTGFLSEQKFKEKVVQILQGDPDGVYHIAALDIDNFKSINELYGFDMGSKILVETARCIRDALDVVDDVRTRNFGDNFFVLLKGDDIATRLTGDEEGYHYLKQALSAVIEDDYKFSFSVGIYTIVDPMIDVSLMMDCAITARNKGKATIGYTVEYYTDSMRIARKIRNNILATMESDTHNREVVVYYQPKVDLLSEQTSGAEALVRWKQDDKVVPPNDFIPIFEKNGFIGILDYYIIDAVCRFISENRDCKIPVIAINLSGVTAMQQDLVDVILSVVNKYHVEAEQIEFEVTESAFVGNFDEAIRSLEILREYGFRIAMDDFGTGVSSLHRLREMPLDTLKIDRGFITDSDYGEKGMAIIENIVRMAKEINLETVAEGIETEEQRDALRAAGCNVGQGYFYARPLPEEEFSKHLKRTI
ncbi:MAG: EAL domain-containing protein [Eubacteriales bacterium]